LEAAGYHPAWFLFAVAWLVEGVTDDSVACRIGKSDVAVQLHFKTTFFDTFYKIPVAFEFRQFLFSCRHIPAGNSETDWISISIPN